MYWVYVFICVVPEVAQCFKRCTFADENLCKQNENVLFPVVIAMGPNIIMFFNLKIICTCHFAGVKYLERSKYFL